MDKCNLTYDVNKFQIYSGNTLDQILKIFADERVPASISQILQIRYDLINENSSIRDFYLDNYFDSSDFVLHNNGNIKIVYTIDNDGNITKKGKKLLDIINSNLFRKDKILILDDFYKLLEGEEFSEEYLRKSSEGLSIKRVKTDKVWRVLARDQAILNECADLIFNEYKIRFGKLTPLNSLRLMKVDYARNKSQINLCCIRDLMHWCDVSISGSFCSNNSRFIGISL
ncbi:MAG: hypothetical protein AABW83_02735 [Nanoarchaeota archaeon]